MRLEGLRAVVLAAGRGVRLRPLTDELPKPLLPIRGKPVLAHTLGRLAALGCREVAINLHHRGEKIPLALGEEYRGMALHYSHEEELLGTLGVFGALRDFLRGAEEVLVVNGDSLCKWPLGALIRRHRKGGNDATLLLAARADPQRYGGGVGVTREGRIVDFGPADASPLAERRSVFAGAHVIAGRLLQEVEARPAETVPDLYRPLLAEGGTIGSVTTRRPWHDLGTPQRLLAGALESPWWRWWPRGGGWISPEATLAEGVRLDGSVIEAGVDVGSGCRVTRTLLLPGARLGADCRLEDTIVGLGAQLLPGTSVRGRLIVPTAPGRDLPFGTTLVGGLGYVPLDEGRPEERT